MWIQVELKEMDAKYLEKIDFFSKYLEIKSTISKLYPKMHFFSVHFWLIGE